MNFFFCVEDYVTEGYVVPTLAPLFYYANFIGAPSTNLPTQQIEINNGGRFFHYPSLDANAQLDLESQEACSSVALAQCACFRHLPTPKFIEF